MPQIMHEDWWKWSATVLLTVCITLAGGWLTFGQKMVSADDVKSAVENGPYSKDKKAIDEKLKALDKIDERTRAIEKKVEGIDQKLNMILFEQQRRRDNDGDGR